MATFTFDGTTSITATKNDTVLISADPTTFTQATDNGSNVTLAFGAQTITITGTTLAAGNLPNVFETGGSFTYADTTNTNGAGTGNVLSFLNNAAYATPATTTASSKIAVFGGLGRIDSVDGNDTISIGGKGSFLVFGNGGDDTINQTVGAFDSTSIVNVNGDTGNDSITFTTASNTKASIFVGGGDGLDTIAIVNSGATFITGGIDSTDGADSITFNGDASGAAGASTLFGNGGNDTINVGTSSALDSTSNSTVYGGSGDDQVVMLGTKATLNFVGGEGADTIQVQDTGGGSIFITGGAQGTDQANDSADQIFTSGGKDVLVYGNLGNDTIQVFTVVDGGTASIYGGKDADNITYTPATPNGVNTATIYGGEGGDAIAAFGNDKGTLTVYGGVQGVDSNDGADSISIFGGSTGTINVYGNVGADTISVGQLGTTDSASVATVYAGKDDDSVVISSQTSASQKLSVFGNEGSDTFTVNRGTGLTVSIEDFATGSGGDKLALTGLGGAPGTLQVVGGSFGVLQAALDAAANAANGTAGAAKAAAVVFSGNTYVVIDNTAGAGFQATDQAIKLTGVTDLVALSGATTLA